MPTLLHMTVVSQSKNPLMLGFYRYAHYNVKTVPFPKKNRRQLPALLQCTYAESASPSTASAERLLLPFRYKIAFLDKCMGKE